MEQLFDELPPLLHYYNHPEEFFETIVHHWIDGLNLVVLYTTQNSEQTLHGNLAQQQRIVLELLVVKLSRVQVEIALLKFLIQILQDHFLLDMLQLMTFL